MAARVGADNRHWPTLVPGTDRKPVFRKAGRWFRCAGPERIHVLAWFADHEQIREDRDQRAFIEERLEECAADGRGDFERGLVRFDFGDNFAGRDCVAFSLSPS